MKTIALLLYLFCIPVTLHATYGKEKTDSLLIMRIRHNFVLIN